MTSANIFVSTQTLTFMFHDEGKEHGHKLQRGFNLDLVVLVHVLDIQPPTFTTPFHASMYIVAHVLDHSIHFLNRILYLRYLKLIREHSLCNCFEAPTYLMLYQQHK